MHLLSVDLNIPIFWGIHHEDPKYFPLQCIPDWALVNPLLYEQIRRHSGRADYALVTNPSFIVDERFHISTKGFLLALTKNERDFNWDINSIWREWDDKLTNLVGYFRYASKQFTLLSDIHSFGPIEVSELPDSLLPIPGDKCVTHAWHIVTAITRDDIEVVSHSILAEPPLAYDTMLLDAMEAILRQDYRSAVLLSAMSMENLARLKLGIAAKNVSNAVGRNDIRNAKIKQLYHDVSLHLLGKSLLKDNPSLYQKVLEIYRKRNEIVHAGAFNDKTDFSAIKMASDSVQCAIQIVDWFGELGGYSSPLNKQKALVICNTSHYPDSPV